MGLLNTMSLHNDMYIVDFLKNAANDMRCTVLVPGINLTLHGEAC